MALITSTAGCTGISAVKTPTAHLPVPLDPVRNRGTVTLAAGRRSLRFDVDDFSYKPTFVRVHVGTTVSLIVANDGSELHSFSIEGVPGTRLNIRPGTSQSITLAFRQPGALTFFCRFHRANGMQGAIVVT